MELKPRGRRGKNRLLGSDALFGAGLGMFTLTEVSMQAKERADMWTLLSAAPRCSYESLATELGSMAQASYGTELVRELTAIEHPEPDVFDLLAALFESLKRDGAKVGRLRVFELRLLASLGLAPFVAGVIGRGTLILGGTLYTMSGIRITIMMAGLVALVSAVASSSPIAASSPVLNSMCPRPVF